MQEIEELVGIQKKVTKKMLKAYNSKGRGKKSTIVNNSISDADFRRMNEIVWKTMESRHELGIIGSNKV